MENERRKEEKKNLRVPIGDTLGQPRIFELNQTLKVVGVVETSHIDPLGLVEDELGVKHRKNVRGLITRGNNESSLPVVSRDIMMEAELGINPIRHSRSVVTLKEQLVHH